MSLSQTHLPRLLVALPAFNEAATIVPVLDSIPRTLAGFQSIDILVVDDGSTDDTAALASAEPRCRVLTHPTNRGVGAAFHTAVQYAIERGYDMLVTIDADGQFDPADIPQLVAPLLEEQAEFVTASRFIDPTYLPNIPAIKLFGNRVVSRIISAISGRKFHDVSCGYRAYSREALLRLNLFGRFTYTQEVFLDLSFKGLRIIEVPIRVRYFAGRRSRVAANLVVYAWRIMAITLASMRDYRPLKFFGLFGLFVFLLGAAFDLFLIGHFMRSGAFSPFKSVGVAGITFNLFGLGLIALGLVAEMLARIRMNQEQLLYYAKKREHEISIDKHT